MIRPTILPHLCRDSDQSRAVPHIVDSFGWEGQRGDIECVAETPAGLDQGRPRLAAADAVDAQPARLLEGAHRSFGGLFEAARVVGAALVAERAQPTLQVAHLLARGSSPQRQAARVVGRVL